MKRSQFYQNNKQNYSSTSYSRFYGNKPPKNLSTLDSMLARSQNIFHQQMEIIQKQINSAQSEFAKKLQECQQGGVIPIKEMIELQKFQQNAFKEVQGNKTYASTLADEFGKKTTLTMGMLIDKLGGEKLGMHKILEQFSLRNNRLQNLVSICESKKESNLNDVLSDLGNSVDELQAKMSLQDGCHEQKLNTIEQKVFELTSTFDKKVKQEICCRKKDDQLIERLMEKLIDKMAAL